MENKLNDAITLDDAISEFTIENLDSFKKLHYRFFTEDNIKDIIDQAKIVAECEAERRILEEGATREELETMIRNFFRQLKEIIDNKKQNLELSKHIKSLLNSTTEEFFDEEDKDTINLK